MAWSTTITGVTSGAAASIEVGCFGCVKLLLIVFHTNFVRAQLTVLSPELIIKQLLRLWNNVKSRFRERVSSDKNIVLRKSAVARKDICY